MSEKFCLKWNDFQSTVSQSFSILRKEEDFFDVTLVTDDEIQMSAHKLVLSACSSFFKNILKTNKHAQPLIYLSGVNAANLGFVLDYIYHGEINIYQDQLDTFLETAQKLKIAGLQSNEQGLESKFEAQENDFYEEQEFVPSDRGSVAPPPLLSTNKSLANVKTNVVANFSLDTQDKHEIDMKVKELITKENGMFKCNSCGKVGGDIRNMQRHVETHIDGLAYPCQLCGKTFRSKNLFSNHRSRFHKNGI